MYVIKKHSEHANNLCIFVGSKSKSSLRVYAHIFARFMARDFHIKLDKVVVNLQVSLIIANFAVAEKEIPRIMHRLSVVCCAVPRRENTSFRTRETCYCSRFRKSNKLQQGRITCVYLSSKARKGRKIYISSSRAASTRQQFLAISRRSEGSAETRFPC